eukprot:3466517-Rhodomonas_salina.1
MKVDAAHVLAVLCGHVTGHGDTCSSCRAKSTASNSGSSTGTGTRPNQYQSSQAGNAVASACSSI